METPFWPHQSIKEKQDANGRIGDLPPELAMFRIKTEMKFIGINCSHTFYLSFHYNKINLAFRFPTHVTYTWWIIWPKHELGLALKLRGEQLFLLDSFMRVNRSKWSINSLPDPICYVFMARTRRGLVFKKRKNLPMLSTVIISPKSWFSLSKAFTRAPGFAMAFFLIFVCFLCFSSLSTDICPESIWIINAQWAKTWNWKLLLQGTVKTNLAKSKHDISLVPKGDSFIVLFNHCHNYNASLLPHAFPTKPLRDPLYY